MKSFAVLSAALVAISFSGLAQAQEAGQPAKATLQEAKPQVGGDVRAPSPKVLDENRRGYFQVGVGPAYGIGFAADTLMYNVQGSYNLNINERITAKGLVDAYLATGSVSSRMINLGLGADVFVPEINPVSFGVPYVNAELALGNGRNAVEDTNSGLLVGAGAGFKFQAAELNWDISANYALMTAPVGNTYPSIIGARAALNF